MMQAPHHQQPAVSEEDAIEEQPVYVVATEDHEDNEDIEEQPVYVVATEDNEDNEDIEDQPVYVVATEDDEHGSKCKLCTDRMGLEFLQDIEEWVYMDCVEHEGVPVHKFCRDVYGDVCMSST